MFDKSAFIIWYWNWN